MSSGEFMKKSFSRLTAGLLMVSGLQIATSCALEKAIENETQQTRKGLFLPFIPDNPLLDSLETYAREIWEKEESYIFVSAKNIGGKDHTFKIPASSYIHLKRKSHRVQDPQEFRFFVTPQETVIQEIAKALTQGSASKEESTYRILEFVRQQEYDVSMEIGADYVKHPLETLVERNGDCEDLSILGASLLKALDIPTVLLHLYGPSANHIALGVQGNFEGTSYEIHGKKYYYAESVRPYPDEYRKIGSIYPQFMHQSVSIIEIPEG